MKTVWPKQWLLVAMVCGFCGLFSGSAVAQEANPSGNQDAVKLKGKLQAIAGNRLKITTDDNQELVMLTAADTTFKYTGTATLQFLSPGLLVRFTAPFDVNGAPQAPISELEIFRPLKMRRMSPELVQSQTPGVFAVADAAPEEAESKDAAGKTEPGDKATRQRSERRKPAANGTSPAGAAGEGAAGGEAVQDYRVVGQLRQLQADMLQVAVGSRPIIVSVDPEAKITVVSGDAFFCQPGDLVEVTGLKNAAGIIRAEEIEVTGAAPLGATGEGAEVRGPRGSRRAPLGDRREVNPEEPTRQPNGGLDK